MQRLAVKCVCTSQFRHRSTSRAVCSAVKPSSTSTLSPSNRDLRSACTIFWRGTPLKSLLYCQWCIPSLVLPRFIRSEEHTSELQSQSNLVCRLLLEKKKKTKKKSTLS